MPPTQHTPFPSLPPFSRARPALKFDRDPNEASNADSDPMQMLIKQFDTDGTGSLDKDELAGLLKAVNDVDVDGDGKLDPEELAELLKRSKAAIREQRVVRAKEAGLPTPPRTPPNEPNANVNTGVPDSSSAMKVWKTLFGETKSVCGGIVNASIGLHKSGFGEPALRFALKCHDFNNDGALTEAAIWAVVSVVLSSHIDPIHMTHLRRAWRMAEKFVKPEVEAAPEGEEGGAEAESAEVGGEGGGEGAAAAEDAGDAAATQEEGSGSGGATESTDANTTADTAAPPAPAPEAVPKPDEPKIMIESFMTLILEDEALSLILIKEHLLPIEAPPETTEEEAAEE